MITRILMILLSLSLISCKKSVYSQVENVPKEGSGGSSPSDPGSNNPTTENACYSLDYTQPDAQLTKKVDLLFVLDTSASLDVERSKIASSIGNFIKGLPADSDISIGVVLAHGDRSTKSGVLYKKGSEPLISNTLTRTLDQVKSDITAKLSSPPEDAETDGGEVGLYSLNKMITQNLAATKAQGFFRDDAALAVVFVSDENDICAPAIPGVTFVRDPQGKETPARTKYCSGITPQNVYNNLKAVKGELPLLLAGILYSDLRTVPHADENELGYGYLETIQLNQGILIDLAGNNFENGLEDIGNITLEKILLQNEFTLPHSGVLLDSIHVKVDGNEVNHTFNDPHVIIDLNDAGHAQSQVEIKYCVPPTSSVAQD